ncbi:MAG: Gfo/Idh/MocA family protein [Candidatus Nitrospinota bacterium M3_3B_026]
MSRARTLAVAGAGYWGRNIIRNLVELGALRSIVENHSGAQEEAARRNPDIDMKGSLSEALADPGVEGVVVVTPAATHAALVRESLMAGKHVFVEKPLCLDPEEGRRLVDLAREKRRILMVGHLLHYHPAVVALKSMIAGGELGPLQYIYSNRLNLGKIRTEENILWSFAPHDISVLLALLGEAPTAVSCHASHILSKDVADVTVSAFTFASGIRAHIFVSWLHPFKEQKLVVVGEKKMAVFDDRERENKLVVYPHVIKWDGDVPVPDRRQAEPVALNGVEPLRAEMEAFLEAIRTGVPPITDGEEGLRVLATLATCQLSMARDGAPVSWTMPG